MDAEPPALLIDGETVALNPTSVDVDVVEFERQVAEGTPAALERAATLYRGELLEGLALQEAPFEEWLLTERERLRELALEALAKLLRHQRTTEATVAALQTALRLLALDPLQEPVHRTVMRLYVQLGRRPSALRQYQICVGILQRELSVEPETTTKQLYQEILRQRPSHAAADVESAATAHAAPAETPASDDTLPRELPLVGRVTEIGRLREVLNRAWEGHGQVAALIGEAGVGKSRLLAELAAEAVARGGRVLVGRCYEAEQILPFAAWVDALRAGRVDADKEVVDSLKPVWRTEVARLLPELGVPGHGPGQSPVDYRQLFESVAQLIRHLALRQPVVLILEDLHWGDEMSLRLLSFLARRFQTWPLLVVGTAREEDLPGAPILRRTLEDLTRDKHLVELRLGPLSKEETLTLVGMLARPESNEAVTAGLAVQVWLISEGNPFAVVEVVRTLPEGFVADPSTKLAVPKRVREVIGRHLEALSERGRDLTTVAAVIGREFDFPLLCRSAGLEEHEAAESLEELVRRRVLHSVGERFDFTHDRIREVAYGDLLRERQRALHARITNSMETLYADRLADQVERLAHHATRGELGEKAARRQLKDEPEKNFPYMEPLLERLREYEGQRGQPGRQTYPRRITGPNHHAAERHQWMDSSASAEQTEAWEVIKAHERAGKGKAASLLDDVPMGLPALTRAVKLSRRAAMDPANLGESHSVDQATAGGKTIAAGFGIGFVYYGLQSIWKTWKEYPTKVFGKPFEAASVSIENNPALLGVGYIIGPRISAIMAAGGVLSYLVYIPAIKFFGSVAAIIFLMCWTNLVLFFGKDRRNA